MTTILIADDDDHIREVVRFALSKAGFNVVEAANGAEAWQGFQTQQPDLLILDIMMPELDGTEVCRKIRQFWQTPIIFLTARDDEVDMIVGLELGGDDYVTKPFSPRQLVARVRAVLRRVSPPETAPDTESKWLEMGHLRLNIENYSAFWQTEELILTATEFRLLQVLAARPGKVFSRDELIQKAYDNVIVSDRTIDSHIRRVRGKIAAAGGDAVTTVQGFGYKLGPCQ